MNPFSVTELPRTILTVLNSLALEIKRSYVQQRGSFVCASVTTVSCISMLRLYSSS